MMSKLKKNVKEDKYTKFFFLFCLLFSISLLILNFVTTKVFNMIGIVMSIILAFGYMKVKKKEIKINKWIILIILLLPILFRVSMLFLKYGNIEGDYLTFLSNGVALANGEVLNTEYISLFPFLYPYMVLLGISFKVLGTSYNVCVLLNLLIEIVGGIFFYLTLKNKFGKNNALKGLIFYLYNPFSILWISKCCPVIVVNTLLIVTIYIFTKVDFNKMSFLVFSVLTGVSIGLTNAFRPFMIIFIIALAIYYIGQFLKTKSWKKLLLSFCAVVLSYLLVNNIVLLNTEKKIQVDLNGSQSGFSMFVGSNINSHGMWNLEDAELFYEKVKELGPVDAHRNVQKMAIERYKLYGIKNIWFLGYKAGMLGRNLDNYTFIDVFSSVLNNVPAYLSVIIKLYLSTYLYLTLFMNVCTSWKLFKHSKCINNFNYVAIFGMGLFVSMLLLEVSPRYFIPILIPIIFVSCLNLFKDDESFY